MVSKYPTLFELVSAALGDKAAKASDFLDMFSEDAVLEYPFAPTGTPQLVNGKESISSHAARLGPLLEFGDFTLTSVYQLADVVIFEATCQGRGLKTGLPYNQQYICVLHLRGGKIVRYQDYWNPQVLIAALGGQEATAKAYAR
jgi:hypothetical protein